MLEGKKVYCFEKDAVYGSAHQAGNALGIDYTQIVKVCRGLGSSKTAKGMHFCYYEDLDSCRNDPEYLRMGYGRRIHAENAETGEILTFSSRKQACEELGVNASNIYAVLKGRQKHTHGWTFWED